MADLNSLSGLKPVETLDTNTYAVQTARTPFRLPTAGEYNLRAADEIVFDVAQSSGAITSQVDPTIADGEFEGVQVRFTKPSAKVFDRVDRATKQTTKASMIADFLISVGYQGQIPGDPEELKALVSQYQGAQFRAYLDWEAQHRASGFKVKGMRNFPKNPDGTYQSWVNHPTEQVVDPATGEKKPLRLRANLILRSYLAPSNN